MSGHAAARPTVDELLASRERMNRASSEFLKIDLETALTFLKIARDTNDRARKERNCRAARKAYDTVAKLVAKVKLNSEDERIVTEGLQKLQKELEALGAQF